ncbi:hypothetical protein KJ969_01060 [Patescibacteria group bacterium]|nr:hypothetical protein [Patescibacteria group bacterium]
MKPKKSIASVNRGKTEIPFSVLMRKTNPNAPPPLLNFSTSAGGRLTSSVLLCCSFAPARADKQQRTHGALNESKRNPFKGLFRRILDQDMDYTPPPENQIHKEWWLRRVLHCDCFAGAG